MTIADYPAHEVTRLITYLNNLKEEAIRINGNEEIINIATKCFWRLFDYFGSTDNGTLEIPDCCPNNGSQGDFHILFTWDSSTYYLECEVMVDGTLEFFYRNKLTKENWGEDSHINDTDFPNSIYDSVLLDKLSYFTY